jgi:hypothetical protein
MPTTNPNDWSDLAAPTTSSNDWSDLAVKTAEPNTPTTTATGAFARGAATGVIPAFGAAGGAAGGAEAGLLAGAAIPVLGELGIGEIGGALVGALVGGLFADKAQKEVIKAASPETYQTLEQYQQQDLKDHPVAAAVGNLASSLPAFRLGNPVTNAKGAAAIYKIAMGKTVSTAEKQLAKTVATQVGLGAAGGVAGPLIQGQTPTAGELTQSIAQTLLFGTPRFGGKVPAGTQDVRAETTTTQTQDQNAKGIRENQGQPAQAGQVSQESQTGSGGDVQQTPPQQPKPVGAREETQQPGLPRGTGGQESNGSVTLGLTPALKVEGMEQPITGGATHKQILDNFTKREDVSDDQKTDAVIAANEDKNHGFLYNGEFKTRKEAQPIFEAAGGKVGNPKKGLQSEDLIAFANAQAKNTPSMGAANVGSEEFSGGNPDIQGVAQPTRVEQAKAGLPVVDQPGTGVNMDQALQHGRTLLAQDPQAADKAAADFAATQKFSYDGFAASRAKYDMVMSQARATEEQYRTDSPEYEHARNEAYKWSKITKDMQTEWHKTGRAQQGMTDIDNGSVIGLETEFHDQQGRDFTPEQRQQAGVKAGKVKTAAEQTDAAQTQFNGELAREARRQIMTKAERDAEQAVFDRHRSMATEAAKAENKYRVEVQKLRTMAQQVQPEAAAKAGEAVTNRERSMATEAAKAETKRRVREQLAKVKLAQVQLKAARQAQQAIMDRIRSMATEAAKREVKNRVHPEIKAWQKVKDYLDAGLHNFDDIRNRVATDLGLPVKRVTELLTQRKRLKLLADDVWRKQEKLRQFKQQANRWLAETQLPPIRRALEKIPRGLFSAKVFGHGTVALGTHAPMVAFQPQYWKVYAQDFAKMYKMVGDRAFFEREMQDLVRRPNYVPARQAGLVVDPFQYEDYNSPETTLAMGRLTGMGNRGYAVLKILRQDMFDQQWNSLPQTTKTPEVAKSLADGINHATGVIRSRVFPKASIALFAPRLLASRAAWLTTDPLKAAETFTHWKNASEADKIFALHQVKEKAWVMGTMLGLLALNQGMLSALGSKQQVNLDDPMKSDWLKFKVAGMDFAYGNQFLTMARLPVRLWRIREKGTGKLKNLIFPDEDSYSVLGEYARGQLSPFASLASTIWFQSDWAKRPLPGSPSPVPKRLAQQGVKPYTWTEFLTEQFAPIPMEEALREVWQGGFHMTPQQESQARKALATLAVMSATGARLTDDIPDRSTQPPTYPPQWFQAPPGRNGGVFNESFGTNQP